MSTIKNMFSKEKEVKRNFEWIDINLLHSGLAYQRPIDAKFVRDVLKVFDKNEIDEPCVSLRDGQYNVVDGQHTIAIVKQKGWTKIRCEIRKNLSIEEENQWFTTTNTKHRAQTKNRILNSRIYSGTDEKLNSLVSALASIGYKLKIADVKSGSGVINATECIEKIYSEMSEKDFINCFTLHQGVWNGDKDSMQGLFLRGMSKFYNTYKNEIDSKRFVTALSKQSSSEIKKEAENDKFTKDVSVKYAKVICAYYNKGIRKFNPLKMSMLED